MQTVDILRARYIITVKRYDEDGAFERRSSGYRDRVGAAWQEAGYPRGERLW